MATRSFKGSLIALPALSILTLVTACGVDNDTTFENVDELKSAVESANYECREMTRLPAQTDSTEGIEEILCTEGHRLSVWGEEFEPDSRSSAPDPFVEAMEEQGAIEHLRGENWHVMSVDGDTLEDLQQQFGGELNEQSFPYVDG